MQVRVCVRALSRLYLCVQVCLERKRPSSEQQQQEEQQHC